MSSDPKPEPRPCCGEGGPSWSPKPGEPQVLACQLCPHPENASYWRRQKR